MKKEMNEKIKTPIKKKIKIIRKNKSLIWDYTKKIIGIIFIILGIISLFLPILQGWLFILIGLAFLRNKSIKKYFNIGKKN